MFIKKNEDKLENKDNNVIEIKQNVEADVYVLKIYFSKDEESIIFKIEPEKINIYYYYEKLNLLELQNYKRFALLKNLKEIYENLEYLVKKQTTKIEKDLSTMIINFIKNKDIILAITLRKKIISQNRLNSKLIGHINEHKNNIKTFKKLSIKLEKNIKSEKEIIDDINNQIDIISNNITNIENDINKIKSQIKNNQKKQNNTENNNSNKNKQNKKEEINNNNDNKDKTSKDTDDFKKIIYFRNKALCKKQKFFEIIFFLNIFIIILIAYLYSNLMKMKKIEEMEKIKRKKIRKKFPFIKVLENMKDEDLKYIKQTFEEIGILEDEDENENKDNINEEKGNEDFDKNNINYVNNKQKENNINDKNEKEDNMDKNLIYENDVKREKIHQGKNKKKMEDNEEIHKNENKKEYDKERNKK